MKKIYLTLTLFIVTVAFASAQVMMVAPQLKPAITKTKDFSKTTHHGNASATAGETRWYSYFDAKDKLAGEVGSLTGNYLFPDSNILASFTGSVYASPWVHNIAQVFDPNASAFNNVGFYPGELGMSSASTYSLDSVEILFAYTRGSTNAFVDTLIVEVNTSAALTNGWFCCGASTGLTIATNLQTDSVYLKNLDYSHLTNKLNLTGTVEFKFPMDAAFAVDTTDNGFNVVSFSTSALPAVGAGKYPVVNVYYKPGYAYSLSAPSLQPAARDRRG